MLNTDSRSDCVVDSAICKLDSFFKTETFIPPPARVQSTVVIGRKLIYAKLCTIVERVGLRTS